MKDLYLGVHYLPTDQAKKFFADADRYQGNWKWARFGSSKSARWVPIARDRDHAFNTYDGLLTRCRLRVIGVFTANFYVVRGA